MQHGKKGYKLGRTAVHRKATLAALAGALIRHKRIRTTLTKAKAARRYVEPLITRARVDTTHNRREVFSRLQDKHAVTSLFDEVAARVGDRSGGYTRIVKLGPRSGDGAEMAIIELVDFNESAPVNMSRRRRRTRRGQRRRRSHAPNVREAAQPDAAGQEPAAEASAAVVVESGAAAVLDSSESADDIQPETSAVAVESDEASAAHGQEEAHLPKDGPDDTPPKEVGE